MRRALLLALCGLVLVVPGIGARPSAGCTAAVKQQRAAALASFLKREPKDRAAYFKHHKRPADRKRFVARQNAQAAKLKGAAACTVPDPANDPPPSTDAEPGFSPSLLKPSFADDHVVDQPWVGEWGPKHDPYWLPSTGTLHGLIVPVDFSDYPATDTVASYDNYLRPTAENYYRDNSYGKLTLDLKTFPRWVRMSKPLTSYGIAHCCPISALRAFIAEATSIIDGEVDFSQVDALYFVGPAAAQAQMEILLWRAWPGEGVTRDGHELRWAVAGAGNFDTRGPSSNLLAHHMITHETGHFFGLADLYDAQARDAGPEQYKWAGRWDIMSDNRASSQMFAWNKWLLGWIDPKQIRGLPAPGTTEAELAPLEIQPGLKAVMVPISATEIYVIEDRQPRGEDSELCRGGVIVWLVDGARYNAVHPAVVQTAARSYTDRCGAIYDAGYDIGAVTTFEDANIRMDVLARLPNGDYRIKVTRK